MQQQYNPRPYAPQVAGGGPAPRNPNGPPNMRMQNGPRQAQPQQQQQQQPQAQHQPQHAMSGVPSSQHPHVQQHAASAPQQQQGQPQQAHPQQMAFTGFQTGGQQFFIPQAAGYQFSPIPSPQGPTYVQFSPHGIPPRFMAPAQGHPANYQIIYPSPQQQQMYQAAVSTSTRYVLKIKLCIVMIF